MAEETLAAQPLPADLQGRLDVLIEAVSLMLSLQGVPDTSENALVFKKVGQLIGKLQQPVASEAAYTSDAKKEIEKILDLAEKLDRKCELVERRELIVLVFVATVAAASATALLSVWSYLKEPFDIYRGSILFGIGCYGVIIGFITSFAFTRARKTLLRERRALRELVDLVRGIEKTLTLTALERAEIRIRLSRFDVGPEYYKHGADGVHVAGPEVKLKSEPG